jgi:hypothetical protein
MSYFYSEPSLVPPPSIPNLFDERTEQHDDADRGKPPDEHRVLTPGVFKANCALSELFYDVMKFNTTISSSKSADMHLTKAAEFYEKLEALRDLWSPNLRMGDAFKAQICYFE